MPDKDKQEFEVDLEIWKKVVDVQMHFNDLCLRLRSFAISILGVLLSATALAYKYADQVQVFSYKTHTASIFMLITMVIWLAFYMMDRYWYHELLRGAVDHGRDIENKLELDVPTIKLADSIRTQSHSSLNMSAATKLSIFYLSIFVILLVSFIMILGDTIKIAS